MVERIGSGGSLQREAVLAALRERAKAAEDVARAAGAPAPPAAEKPSFAEALREGVRDVEREIRAADALPADLVSGQVADFHEIAARVKRADLSFKFALEIRNKLIDAYREVMRMQV